MPIELPRRFSLRTLLVVVAIIAAVIVFWPTKPPVLRVYEAFVEDVAAQRYQAAHERLTPEYQSRYTLDEFVQHFSRWGPPREPIAEISVLNDKATIVTYVRGNPQQRSTKYTWKLVDESWRLDGIHPYLWKEDEWQADFLEIE